MTDLVAAVGPFVLEFCGPAELDAASFQPAAWLTPAESAKHAAFPSEKRRRDWLSGRVAAKRALARLTGRTPLECPVVSDAEGRPGTGSLDVSLSITHCALGAAAAARRGGPVGLDWEPVAERPARVIELFARPDERDWARDARSQTRLWTLKEAALKLLGLGLGVEGGAHALRVDLSSPQPRARFFGAADDAWRAKGAPEIHFFEKNDERSCLAVAHTGG